MVLGSCIYGIYFKFGIVLEGDIYTFKCITNTPISLTIFLSH